MVITENEITLLINLIIGLVAGYLIGVERESRGKDAGISTHTLVIIGSMLFTFLSVSADPASPSRIAAQIVTGIGFLGAGLIIKEGATVRNLTTAASVWVASSIGMALGFNYRLIALIITILAILIPRIPHVRKKIPDENKMNKE